MTVSRASLANRMESGIGFSRMTKSNEDLLSKLDDKLSHFRERQNLITIQNGASLTAENNQLLRGRKEV